LQSRNYGEIRLQLKVPEARNIPANGQVLGHDREKRKTGFFVMAGLVPAIHVLLP
jgi:hypothetical protein